MLVRNMCFPFSQSISMTINNISFENNAGGPAGRSAMRATPGLNDLLACSVIGPDHKGPLLVFRVFCFLLKDSFMEV